MMATVLQKHTKAVVNDDAGILERLQRSPSEVLDVSTNNCDDNLQLSYDRDSEDDAPKKRVKRRIQQFSDSESDREVQQNENGKSGSEKKTNIPEGSESDSDLATFNSLPHKSRILKLSNGSSSDSESSQSYKTAKESTSKEKSTNSQGSETNSKSLVQRSPFQKICEESSSDSDQAVKNEQQQTRMKNKRNKMKDKFKSLMTSRGKDKEGAGAENESNKSASDSEHSNNEANSSIEKIKQKIKERMSFKPSVCDPDTSDEENSRHKSMPKQKQERRTKLTSPKPQRMSAKQAMENMQKIKSESNRMLREKEVSLPYHRPKALSLKDIMSRRKPAVSSDGKSLPIKMNGEQLKQYAQMLDERQKQMMELWQSDTDDENDDKKSDDEEASAKTIDDMKPDDQIESSVADEPKEIEFDASENANEINADISAKNDNLFDVLSQSIIKDTTKISESKVLESDQESEQKSTNIDKVSEEQDSEASMKLVFNDSETSITEEKNPEDNILVDGAIKNIEECTVSEKGAIQSNEANTVDDKNIEHKDSETAKTNTEMDSQLMCLHYDSEKFDGETLQADDELAKDIIDTKLDSNEKPGDDIINIDEEIVAMDVDHGFSDDDMNIEDIDNIIENAEIIRDIEDRVNSQALLRHRPLNLKPTLTGAPGTVIDLNDCDNLPKKSGVELLKERFTFYAKMKTPEELERDRERRIKPGNQHLKLKQKLEDQMAEQRSLEWAKRLDDEKQQQNELKQLRGEDSDDDIDKMEAKLEDGNEENVENEAESESAQEELLENDVEVKDQPRVKNPLVENEAEESDCDEDEGNGDGIEETKQNEDDENEQENGELNDADGDDENDDDESSDSESSESEEEQATAKKGRILKAFEDSDDEVTEMTAKEVCETQSVGSVDLASQPASQDEVLTLAQRYKSGSEDLFTSQGSSLLEAKQKSPSVSEMSVNDADLGTQTFSILDSTNIETTMLNSSDKLSVLCGTQAYDDNLDAVAAMCSDSFSQNLPELSITQASQSQSIGEDILALCTGKFYENEFVSQVDDNHQMPLGASQDYDSFDDDSQNGDKGDGTQANAKDGDVPNINKEDLYNKVIDTKTKVIVNTTVIDTEINMNIDSEINKIKKAVDNNLKSILDELHDPEFDTPKPNKFFCGDETQKGTEDLVNKEVESHVRKKLIIDSDDDSNDVSEIKKRKKFKKKKPEKRALQISDDEEESDPEQGIEDSESDIEEETVERLVEYDSEENEIEVKPQKPSKKKHKGTEFFEQEAELTSEDEWVGSGDEDEAGLDRMEREAGDDESFHQGQLQRELGQIHMRDVLDQDKREVRIIQELLFEDGDLGGGGRQRKFKWRNLDGDDETGAGGDELGDTQEEEFESEEQWRKQRHERETFLRQMQNNGEDSLNVSISRTSIIKANLMSKTMSMLLEENQPVVETDSTVLTEQTDSPRVTEKKTSPKKQFSILQQSYQGSILSRGRGALARLAALATPLAADDDAPKGKSAAPSNGRNFVFAALTPEAPKVMKRKAEPNPSTPKLVKKMKTEDIKSTSKSSLLDRMRL